MGQPPRDHVCVANKNTKAAAAARIGAELAGRKREALLGLLRPGFARGEPLVQARKYVRAVMSDLPARNGWSIAEFTGDESPDKTQRLLNRASWDALAAMSVVRKFAVEGLEEAARRRGRRRGLLRVGALDETGQEKKGDFLSGSAARATGFGRVHRPVHAPQHRPVPGASMQLKSATSDWSQETKTNSDGEFLFAVVPLGDYIVTAGASGFSSLQQDITLASDTSSILHFQLALASVNQTTIVTASVANASADSVTPTTLIDRTDIAQTPGADSTNSLAMITDYTPGAYLTHDMLHMRGGHQTTWLIDGAPIPNMNIATK